MRIDGMDGSPGLLRSNRRKRAKSNPRRLRALNPVIALALASQCLQIPSVVAFTFAWSTTSYQCVTQVLTWSGGTPPFTAVVAPLLQFPFVYRIPSTAYNPSTSTWSYPIQIQLISGLQYVLFMSDATGIGTGGSTESTTVQGFQDSTCLATASRNQSVPMTTFEVVADNVEMCSSSFAVSWAAENGTAPFNMTVIPLHQSFDPFDVPLGSNGTYDWEVNVQAGRYFTVMMNDADNLGVGGVAGAYQVNATRTEDTSCLDDPKTSTVTGGTATAGSNTGSSTSEPGPGPSSGLPGKIIAVIASIGAVIGVIASAIATFLYIVVKRRRKAALALQNNRRPRPTIGDAQNSIDLYDAPSPGEGRYNGTGGLDGFEDSASDANLNSYSPLSAGYGPGYADLPATPTGPSVGATSAGAAGLGANPKDGMSWVGGSRLQRDREGGRGHRTQPSHDSLGTYENPFAGSAEDVAALGAGLGRSGATPVYGDPLRDGLDDNEAYVGEATRSRQALPSLRTTKSEKAARDAAGTSNTFSTLPPVRQTSPIARPPPNTGNFRVTNAAADDPIAPEHSGALPASASPVNPTQTSSSVGRRYRDQQPRFVRHEDAGLVRGGNGPGDRQSGEVIDLPPLYTDLMARRGEESPDLSPVVETRERPDRGYEQR